MNRIAPWIVAALLAYVAAAAFAADPAPADIDRIFATWDKPDSPGVALAVVRDGKIVYSRGYGLANLEYGVPISPTTVFHAASLSKQFTAFSVHLLAQEGKLSLDDPVKTYLPELQVEGPVITVRHLLHHTSGLRDNWDLVTLAGLRLDDAISEGDLLGLLWQQKQTNFPPGDEELYSNSGYTLLGQVVKRVSGKTLAAFAKERIFDPLGMKNTHFHESYGALVKGRAYSYERLRDGSWRYVALSFSNTGATSLFTTVEDLALWNNNYDNARAGNAGTVAAMLAVGKLNSGRDIAYASGVVVAPYRGLPSVSHSGSDAGFRSYFLRLPQQKLAVVVLGNAADFNSMQTAGRVADLYLEGTAGLQPPTQWPAEVELQARDLAAFAGDYEVRPGGVLSFAVENGRLYSVNRDGRTALFASAPNQFFAKVPGLTVSFPATTGNEAAPSAVMRANGQDYPMKRLVRETPSPEALQACTGDYYSEELRTLYTVSLREGKPVVRYPRGVLELRPVNRDIFRAGYPMGTFVFQRDAAGTCVSATLTTGRVRNLKFAKVTLGPSTAQSAGKP